jgi:integral membrane sensor domain MASE1
VILARWFLPVAWVFCFLVFFAAFRFGGSLGRATLAMIFTCFDVSTGMVNYARTCAKQGPAMRAHIDRERIKRRLAELGD